VWLTPLFRDHVLKNSVFNFVGPENKVTNQQRKQNQTTQTNMILMFCF
jgi:hypothetical protein